MKLKYFFYSAVLLLFIAQGFAQKKQVAKADKYYNSYSYVDAIAIYEQLAEKGYSDEKMFQKLGNASYFKADLVKAAKWYGSLFALNVNQEPEYFYRYSQSLKSIEKYDKANQMMDQFNILASKDNRAKLYEDQKNYLEIIKSNSGRFTISDAGINSQYSDYGSSFLGNKLLFASARDTGGVSKKVFKWTNESFTNLYSTTIQADGVMSKPERFAKNINSKFHESTPVFTKDGKTMYFTRNNYLEGKRGKDDKKITLLKIYKATLIKEKWVIAELPFNSDKYSTAHPALSDDENTLYFASDMPGTMGQSDLFKVSIYEDDNYGAPENLGAAINTEGRETFPFVSSDSELYFASDGHPGLGGLDVFVVKVEANQSFYNVQNVGMPLNSPQDDFGFLINSEDRKGFFTSNRPGKGYDDIYKFTEIKKLTCEQSLSGIITDQETGDIILGAKISLLDSNFKLIKEIVSVEKGYYSFEVECKRTYYVRAEKDTYETKETSIQIKPTTGKTELSIQLEKIIKPIGVGTDLAKTLNIPIIYFDLDQSIIRKDAAFELQKIVTVMQQYPTLKIDVRSHTDSRQTAKYNQKLSERRAQATISWLIANGIEANRLTGKGYGESRLLNKCEDNMKCTEDEHQVNRRSEFIILAM